MRPRELNRGQEINIYVPVDAISQPVIRTVAFVGVTATAPLEVEEATPAPALPTTG